MRRTIAVALDYALIALAIPAALLLRENFVIDLEKFENHTPFLIATLIVALPLLKLFGVEKTPWRYCTIADHIRIAIAVGLIVLAATLLTFFYNRLDGIARSTPVLELLLATTAMVSLRVAMRLRSTAKSAPKPFAPIERDQQQSVLLVGLTSLSELYVKAVAEYGEGRIRVAGIVDYADEVDGMRVQQLPVFAGHRGIQSVVNELAVHGVFIERVVITTTLGRLGEIGRKDLTAFTAQSPTPVELFADNIGLVNWAGSEKTGSAAAQAAPGTSDVTFAFSDPELSQISQRAYWSLKRGIDLVVALGMILVLWPIALLVGVAVAFEIGLPVLFWQLRPGVGGRPFKLYKFRTMSGARDRSGRMKTDAERLGRIGRFLRATRLDELPQLWNILVGEMSFIGPRPLLPVDQAPAFSARLLVRPGLTGWGQIKGGRDIPAADKAALDIWYVKNASFALDLEIIKGTIPMVLRGERVHRDAIEQAWRELRQGGIC